LLGQGKTVLTASDSLNFFLNYSEKPPSVAQHLDTFCNLDDYDVMCTIKNWTKHDDKILSRLCHFLVDRKLLKVKLQAEPFDENLIFEKKSEAMTLLKITEEEAGFFVFTGEVINTTYDRDDERINILFKDGSVKDISEVDNALIHKHLSSAVKKYYFCYLRV
jgi:hypothetical protein